MAAFHETRMGQEFFAKQLPELIGAISSLGDAIRECRTMYGNPSKDEEAISLELASMMTTILSKLPEEQKDMLAAYLEKNAERESLAMARAFSQGVWMRSQVRSMKGEET